MSKDEIDVLNFKEEEESIVNDSISDPVSETEAAYDELNLEDEEDDSFLEDYDEEFDDDYMVVDDDDESED